MPRGIKMLMRIGGLAVVGVALLAQLPNPWTLVLGILGVVLFFAAGPT